MKFEKVGALNIEYLLLEFYKQLNIKEREVMVILMLNHLSSQGNDFITSDLLALKMNMSLKEIDDSLSILFTKGYIEFITKGDKTITSLKPLQKILIKTFEKTIYTEDELEKNQNIDEIRTKVFQSFEDAFNRPLSPVEITRVDAWISDGVEMNIILDSLTDALKKDRLSIQYIDRLIISKLKDEDRDGNDLLI